MCGTISDYEQPTPPPGPRNIFLAVAKELTLRGLRGNTHVSLMPELWREVGQWLRDGAIVNPETVIDGLENAPVALAGMMHGDTTGKTLVRIARGADE
jgi:hypothetical protein